jgi:uncharacterized protein with ATP-grasp and redox domains
MSGFNGAKTEDRVRVSLTVEGKVIGLGQNSIGVLLDDFDSRNREVIWFPSSSLLLPLKVLELPED